MGSEEESSAPKLALFSLPPINIKSADQFGGVGMVTPPHHLAASVPFRWEEEPGKPRPCSTPKPPLSLTPFKGLELPPRLQFESKFTKTPSPTTVLEGPYVGRSIFHSFRLIRHGEGSFDGGESVGSSPDRGLLGSVGLSRRWLLQRKEKGDLGSESWRKRGFSLKQGKKEVVVDDEGSFVFSTKVEVTRITRKRSLLGLTKVRSNFWATIYGAVKQVIPSPRRSKWKN